MNSAPVRLAACVLLAVFGAIAIAAGTAAVVSRVTVTQPKGTVLGWGPAQAWTVADPVRLDAGRIPLTITGDDSDVLTVQVDAATASAELHTTQQIPSAPGPAFVAMPPGYTGCHLVRISSDKLPTLRLLVTDGTGDCPRRPIVDLFARFGIPAGGAPIESVSDLLIYIQSLADRVDLQQLPPDYRACLEQTDPTAMADCLGQLDATTAPTP